MKKLETPPAKKTRKVHDNAYYYSVAILHVSSAIKCLDRLGVAFLIDSNGVLPCYRSLRALYTDLFNCNPFKAEDK